MAGHVHIYVHDAPIKSWGRKFVDAGKLERIFYNIMEMEPRPQDISFVIYRANSIDDIAVYLYERWFKEWRKEDPSVPDLNEVKRLCRANS